jgi:hypothetical protein
VLLPVVAYEPVNNPSVFHFVSFDEVYVFKFVIDVLADAVNAFVSNREEVNDSILANSILADAEKVCNDEVATFIFVSDIKVDALNVLSAACDVLSDAVNAFNAPIEFIVDELNVLRLLTDVFTEALFVFSESIDTLADAVNALVEAVYALNDADEANVWSANTVILAIAPSILGIILAETYPLKKNLVEVPIDVPLTII